MNSSKEDISTLILRVALGVVLLAHGLLKIMVFTIPGTVGYFESLGLPAVIAYLTIFGEVVGGVALILGLFTRLTAALSVPILLGATWAHIGNGWLFSAEGGGWEFPLLLVVLAISVAIKGSGAFGLDRIPAIERLLLTRAAA